MSQENNFVPGEHAPETGQLDPAQLRRKDVAIAALIFAVGSLLLCAMPFFMIGRIDELPAFASIGIGILSGITAFILGIVALKRKQSAAMSVVAVVIGSVMVLVTLALGAFLTIFIIEQQERSSTSSSTSYSAGDWEEDDDELLDEEDSATNPSEQSLEDACIDMLGPMHEANIAMLKSLDDDTSDPQAAVNMWTELANGFGKIANESENSEIRSAASAAHKDLVAVRDAMQKVLVNDDYGAIGEYTTAYSNLTESYGDLLALCG